MLAPGGDPYVPRDGGRLVLDPETVSLDALGATARYEALWWQDGELRPAEGCRWSVADGSVAAVSGEGTVTALRNGSTEVRATCGDTTATAPVGVWQAVADLAVDPAAVDLGMWESERVRATARDPNGNYIERPLTIGWSSSDDLAVAVEPDDENPARARITRYSPGDATVLVHVDGKTAAVRVGNPGEDDR
jgi:hypothetical protein